MANKKKEKPIDPRIVRLQAHVDQADELLKTQASRLMFYLDRCEKLEIQLKKKQDKLEKIRRILKGNAE